MSADDLYQRALSRICVYIVYDPVDGDVAEVHYGDEDQDIVIELLERTLVGLRAGPCQEETG